MTGAVRQLGYDLRHGVRALARRPAFVLVTTFVFGLGVGANVAIFDLAHSIFVRPLPFPDAERLIGVYQTRDGSGHHPMSWPDFVDLRRESTSVERLAAHYSTAPLQVESGDDSALLTGAVVSADYFPMLGVDPAHGRFFRPEELAFGGPPVAVLSHRLWQRWFGGAADVGGATVTINGVAFAVVGVAAEGFDGVLPGVANQLWIPTAQAEVGYRFCDPRARDCTFLNVLGRRAPGRTLAEARTELGSIAGRLAAAHPGSHAGLGIVAVPARGLRPDSAAHHARTTRTLALIVGAVLLIACANLASLVLVRHWGRAGELAVRRALGASRGRIVGQLLGESLLLAALGAVVALALGAAIRRLLVGFFVSDPSTLRSAAVPVVLFTLALSAAAALAVALGPALLASRAEPGTALREGRFAREGRWRSALVVTQLAVSLALLVGTGLLAGSLLHLEREAPFDAGRAVSLRLRPRLAGFDAVRAADARRRIVERLETLPWVESVSYGEGLPAAPYHDPVEVRRPDRTASRRIDEIEAGYDRIAPRYFGTLGLRPLAGREFRADDENEVVVGAALASRLWPAGDAFGRTLVVGDRARTVIGVAPDLHRPRSGEPPLAAFYLPFDGSGAVDSRLIVRVRGDAAAAIEPLRSEIARLEPALPLTEATTLEARLGATFRPVRLAGVAIAAAGALGLLLAVVGLYGVLALRIARRRREIGVRMAVGARPGDVVAMVLREGAVLAVAGLMLGAPLAFALARGLAGYLYGISPHAPAAHLSMAAVLLAAALAASWFPARRAAAVEPTAALRSE